MFISFQQTCSDGSIRPRLIAVAAIESLYEFEDGCIGIRTISGERVFSHEPWQEAARRLLGLTGQLPNAS